MNAISIDRRRFFVSVAAVGGALVVGVQPRNAAAGALASGIAPWLSIASDDTVTVFVATPEIGNGVLTQCAMLVAEELGCAWSHIHAEPATPTFNYLNGELYTKAMGRLGFFAGRSTTPARMTTLLQVGASARERLRAAAAQRWQVPVSEIEARDSLLRHKSSGRTLRYGEVAEQAAKVSMAEEPALKPQSQWSLLGKSRPGKLGAAKVVDGSAVYGMDVRLPGMLYAALRQAPVHGGRLKSYDFEAIRQMPGVHSVVVVDPSEPRTNIKVPAPLPDLTQAASGVAVVAEHYWQARQALDALPVAWEAGPGADWATHEKISAAALAVCEAPAKEVLSKGDALGRLGQAGAKTVSAAYLTPFCDHVTMEPLNGTALVTPERTDLWHPSQNPQQAFAIAVEESGVHPSNVHVHQTLVGGGFGRRVHCDDVRMVVAVARKVPGRPVHVIWSREESMRQGRYRPLVATKMTASLGEDGLPDAFLARYSGVGASTTGLVTCAYANGPIPNFRVEGQTVPAHIRTGPYRGPNYNAHAFMVESFIDECAAAAGADPLDYRLKLLARFDDPAWTKCLKVVAEKSGWGGRLPRGQGRGVAISNWSATAPGQPKEGTTVAAVARVEVSRAGELKVRQIDMAFDCGQVIDRDGVLAQLEGGAVFGLNMSLNEMLTIRDGQVVEGNYNEYPMLRMGDLPDIRIHFDALSGNDRYSEVGEPPVGPIGPAIANAIFAATGKRIRQTPFRLQDLSWA